MRIAGQKVIFVFFATGLEGSEKTLHLLGQLLDAVSEIHFQIHQNLVVPGPSAMYFLTCLSYALREHKFDLRVYVFNAVFDGEITCADLFFKDLCALF